MNSGKILMCLAHTKKLNMELEKAGRVADYLDFAQLLITDALRRNESCGAHFGKSTRHLKEKLSEMMKNMPMWRPGNMPERIKNLSCTGNI
jgi:succinate dehydrogenase/fumarate reductase flavoprotein subunit